MVSLSISCCCYDDLGLQGEGGGRGGGWGRGGWGRGLNPSFCRGVLPTLTLAELT